MLYEHRPVVMHVSAPAYALRGHRTDTSKPFWNQSLSLSASLNDSATPLMVSVPGRRDARCKADLRGNSRPVLFHDHLLRHDSDDAKYRCILSCCCCGQHCMRITRPFRWLCASFISMSLTSTTYGEMSNKTMPCVLSMERGTVKP